MQTQRRVAMSGSAGSVARAATVLGVGAIPVAMLGAGSTRSIAACMSLYFALVVVVLLLPARSGRHAHPALQR